VEGEVIMKLFTIVSLSAILTLTGCSNTQTEASALTDSQVEDGIKARFDADSDLRQARLDVDANVADKKVELSGTVPSEGIRTRAVSIAESYHPGFAITAKVDVKPPDVPREQYTEDMARDARERARKAGNSVGDSLDDAWIHTKITTKLATTANAPVVNVDVEKNMVTLRGTVDTAAEKMEVERIAKSTEGVKSVRNLLTIKG
jgi:osmotically-inducible protein OsmY